MTRCLRHASGHDLLVTFSFCLDLFLHESYHVKEGEGAADEASCHQIAEAPTELLNVVTPLIERPASGNQPHS